MKMISGCGQFPFLLFMASPLSLFFLYISIKTLAKTVWTLGSTLENRKNCFRILESGYKIYVLWNLSFPRVSRDEVEGLHNCREFSQPLECLYQAMQTQEKKFSIAFIKQLPLKATTREKMKNSFYLSKRIFLQH